MSPDQLRGWDAIATYLGVDRSTAQRYEKKLGLPIRRFPGEGPKPPVFAIRRELDQWMYKQGRLKADLPPPTTRLPPTLSESLFERITNITQGIRLYRRNYILRFNLKRSRGGIQADVGYEYELINPTHDRQAFMQEITLDDSERGHVESMSLLKNDRPVCVLRNPALVEKPVGYSIYRGPEILIEPHDTRTTYEVHASYVINRSENEIWHNLVVLPTIGVRVETSAPPDFAINPSYAAPGLLMTGEHLDIAWNRRK